MHNLLAHRSGCTRVHTGTVRNRRGSRSVADSIRTPSLDADWTNTAEETNVYKCAHPGNEADLGLQVSLLIRTRVRFPPPSGRPARYRKWCLARDPYQALINVCQMNESARKQSSSSSQVCMCRPCCCGRGTGGPVTQGEEDERQGEVSPGSTSSTSSCLVAQAPVPTHLALLL